MSHVSPGHIKRQIQQIIDILSELNRDNPSDYAGNLNQLCSRNLEKIPGDVGAEPEDLLEVKRLNADDNSIQWKYIVLNFQYVFQLRDILRESNSTTSLSVHQTKILKTVFRNVIGMGLASNLYLNTPYYTELSIETTEDAPNDFLRHKRLAATAQAVITCTKIPTLRFVFVSEYLKYILWAFYQIIYCPFKKPTEGPDLATGFVMTQEIYNRLVSDRDHFKRIFPDFVSAIHPVLYVRQTMMLLRKSSPNWMKKAVSASLSELIRGPKGVESVSSAMLDASGLENANDTNKSWKALDVIAKIVLDSQKLPDFRDNICKQLRDLLELRTKSGEPVKSFERLFTLCTKLLYQQNESLCQEMLITHLLKSLIRFTSREEKSFDENVTGPVTQTAFLLRSLIDDDSSHAVPLPVGIVVPVLGVIFQIDCVIIDCDALKGLHEDLKAILLKVLQGLEPDLRFSVFDDLLFDFPCESLLQLQKRLEFHVENDLLMTKTSEHVVKLSPLRRADVLTPILKENSQTTPPFFSYLLNCMINREKYCSSSSCKDLLHVEHEIVPGKSTQIDMAVYKALSELIEDENVRKQINDDPSEVSRYMEKILRNGISSGLHKSCEFESNYFQTLFLIVMVLQALVENVSAKDLHRYKSLVEPLSVLKEECGNAELKEMSGAILTTLTRRDVQRESSAAASSDEKTELEKALDDICDPLLPVKGHGLMTLTKLIGKKDKRALERKHYILNIFQQNLNNEDSFVYLNAIGGLAAMGELFPDIVLGVLAEEYLDFTRREGGDGHEVRMKLGEVLMRVVRVLGEIAPKYKSLLLNTFLAGAKDEDHLIRASSLSNLGEVCKVLGYKLGTIVTEVLVCVHAVISTDKAAEARRAAVTVLRQLFAGLEKEMIVFLKDDILPLYRALKHIYHHDSDDVIRLQAQLALEQLNENMKDFVFPQVQLHNEKKVVLLN